MFRDWIERKYLDYRGDSYGNDNSITDFAKLLGVGQSLLSEWMSGKKRPGAKSLTKIAQIYPDVYAAMGMPVPEADQLEELPPGLRARLKKAFDETRAAYRAENISLNSPEAERIAKEIFERNGIKYITTVDVDDESVV